MFLNVHLVKGTVLHSELSILLFTKIVFCICRPLNLQFLKSLLDKLERLIINLVNSESEKILLSNVAFLEKAIQYYVLVDNFPPFPRLLNLTNQFYFLQIYNYQSLNL